MQPTNVNLNVTFDNSYLNFISNMLIIGYFLFQFLNIIFRKFDINLIESMNKIVHHVVNEEESEPVVTKTKKKV